MPMYKGQVTHDIPYGIAITKNSIDSLSGIHKFGYNAAVSTAFETIWDAGGTYTFPSAAGVVTLTSTSGATDSGVEVTIQGLDASYVEQSETVTLDASGTFTTTNQYLRLHRAFVSGSTATVGDITMQISAATVAIVKAEYQQTQMLVYTIPAGKTGYLLQVDASVQKNQEIVINVNIREQGKVFRTKATMASFGTPVHRRFDIPDVIPEKSDIRIDAKAGSTTEVAGEFELILEDN